MDVRRHYQAVRLASLDRVRREIPGVVERLRRAGVTPYSNLADAALSGALPLAPGATEVWYVKGGALDREAIALMGDRAVHAGLLHMTHVCLGAVSEEDPERLFLALQAENWSPRGEAAQLVATKGLLHTSMSVGDAIRKPDGQVLVCSFMGFREASMPTPDWLARFYGAVEGLLRREPGGFLSLADLVARAGTAPGVRESQAWSAEGFSPAVAVTDLLTQLHRAHLVQVGAAPSGAVGYRMWSKDEPYRVTAYQVVPSRHGERYLPVESRLVTSGTVAREATSLKERCLSDGHGSLGDGARLVILSEAADSPGGFATVNPIRG
jgi:hypothetical protein